LWVGEAPREDSPNSLFRNEGALSFTDVAAAAGLDENAGTVGGVWGDVDDDGDPDLLVGGEEFLRPTSLFRNDGAVFADASSIFAPALPVLSGADLGDLDNDGDLDLVACNGHYGVFDAFAEGDSVSFFFNDRYVENGVDRLTIPSGADTLWAELRVLGSFVTGLVFLGPDGVHPPFQLPIVLTDEYVGAPTLDPGLDRGIWVYRTSPGGPWELLCSSPVERVDNFHGWFSDGGPITGTVAHDLEDPHFSPGGPRVWRNAGGAFIEITSALGLPTMLNPRDVSWVDYDNDGDLDIHVVDMGTSASQNAPDGLFRNDGASFADVTDFEAVAASAVGMGDGATWGDVDRDGDLDLYVAEGAGPLAFSRLGPGRFLENAAARGNAILVDVVGRDSGTLAIGSRVRARAGGLVVHRRVSANAWRGFSDPLRVHLGLGGDAVAESLIVEWPAGGVDAYTSVPAGTYRLNEQRDVVLLSILPASPDSITPAQIGLLHFEASGALGSRASGEAPNFRIASLNGLLAPQGLAVESADSTYAFSYLSALGAGVDTLVVTDPLSDPPLADSLEVRIVTPTAAPDVHPLARFMLEVPRPNPFTSSCRIEYGLPRGGAANLAVYDVRGRRVRTLATGSSAPGRHAASWDGVDAEGRPVPPGVYFVRLESGGSSSTRKLVRVR
ncbi:MAG: FG-GAP-like repeat-containing protein, partial [bacterium]